MTTPLDRYGTAIYGVGHYARTHSGGPKMNQQVRVLMDFTSMPDPSLDEFTETVISNMTGNTSFTQPPLTMAALQALLDTFAAALGEQAQGGTAATSAKNDARVALVDALRQIALYVQVTSNNSLTMLLTSGFQAVNTNRAQQPLDQPKKVTVENGNTGQLFLRLKPINNARAYEVRYATVGTGGTLGPWQNGGTFISTRNLAVTGLTPGTTYTIEIRAIGGSTGYSDWSDPVSHMSL